MPHLPAIHLPRSCTVALVATAAIAATVALAATSALVLLVAFGDRHPAAAAPTCTKIWTGVEDDSWSTPANWQPSGRPGQNDYACADEWADIYFDDDLVRTVKGLDIKGSLTIDYGELRIGLSSASGFEPSYVGDLTLADRRGGRAPLTITGSLTVYSGGVLGSPDSATYARYGTTTLAPGAELFLDDELSIEGRHTFRNEGRIDWLFGDVWVCESSTFVNAGLISANTDGSGVLDCGVGTNRFLNTTTGTLRKLDTGYDLPFDLPFANAGSVVVDGDTLSVRGQPAGSTDSGSYLLNAGALQLAGNRTFGAGSSVAGDGQVAVSSGTVNLGPVTSLARLQIAGGSVVGNATVTAALDWRAGSLQGPGTTTVAAGATATISQAGAHNLSGGHTLRNLGTVSWVGGAIGLCDGSKLSNEGVLTISGTAASVTACGGPGASMANTPTGTITKASGGEVTLGVATTNHGTLAIAPGQSLRIQGPFTNLSAGTLSGGTYHVGAGGTLRLDSAATGISTNAAAIRLDGPAAAITNGSGANALGALTANTTSGVIDVRDGQILPVTGTLSNAGLISGTGTLQTASVINAGTIRPAVAGPGTLTFAGGLEQTGTGTLEVYLAGTTAGTDYGRLAVTGTAILGGTLRLNVGYTPGVHDQHTVVTAASRNGTFASLVGSPGGTNVFRVRYTATAATVTTDALPIVSIADSAVLEGDQRLGALSFSITLDAPSPDPVSVAWSTADGTATAPEDYLASSGLAVIEPGATMTTVSVPVVGDTEIEDDESFQVVLADPIGAVLGTSRATGTIVNDDAPEPVLPVASVGDASLWEGDTGVRTMLIPLTFDRPTNQPFTLRYRLVGLTASGGRVDFDDGRGAERTITVKPRADGLTPVSKIVPVRVFADTEVEGDETFGLELLEGTGVRLGRTLGVGTILDDDTGGVPGGARVGVSSMAVVEGHDATVKVAARVTLSAPAAAPVTVTLTAEDQSATAGVDYNRLKAKTIAFRPGQVHKTVWIVLRPNVTPDGDRTLRLVLGQPAGASIQGAGHGVLTILDDD